jgi:hypothetical protein
MSLYSCACPVDQLEAIAEQVCRIKKPKVQALLFRKQGNAPFIDTVNGAEEALSWNGLFDSGDTTLIVRTPNISNFEIGEAEVIEGEENYEGASTSEGLLPQPFTATLSNPSPATVKQIDKLFCHGEYLQVAFIYADDTMQMQKDPDASPTELTFFNISPETFITSAPKREGGQGAKFLYDIQFKLGTEWYAESEFVTPEAGFSFVKDLKVGFTSP